MPNFKNLVFKGGGVRGIAYIGALEYMYREGLMRSVQRTAGTSAGAITAAVLALNYDNFEEVREISDSLDYRRVPAEEDPRPDGRKKNRVDRLIFKRQIDNLFKNAQCTLRLVQEKGWFSSAYLYEWLRGVIARRFTVKKAVYTFRDFRDPRMHVDERPFMDPYITGSDISNRAVRVFSWETTPDMEVALAVRISMSIPIFFEAIPFRYPGTTRDQMYADGGVFWNYPIAIFDDTKYNRRLADGINPETLGFFLFTSPEHSRHKEVNNLMDYVGAVFESLLLVQDQFTLYGSRNKERTVFISDMGIPPTQFEVAVGDKVYQSLYDSGFQAARDFFSNRINLDMLIHKVGSRLGWKGTEY